MRSKTTTSELHVRCVCTSESACARWSRGRGTQNSQAPCGVRSQKTHSGLTPISPRSHPDLTLISSQSHLDCIADLPRRSFPELLGHLRVFERRLRRVLVKRLCAGDGVILRHKLQGGVVDGDLMTSIKAKVCNNSSRRALRSELACVRAANWCEN